MRRMWSWPARGDAATLETLAAGGMAGATHAPALSVGGLVKRRRS